MRPTYILCALLISVVVGETLLFATVSSRRNVKEQHATKLEEMVHTLGLTDLAISTEARYTRHVAVTDKLAPFMDHLGSIEHFPSGTFYSSPQR